MQVTTKYHASHNKIYSVEATYTSQQYHPVQSHHEEEVCRHGPSLVGYRVKLWIYRARTATYVKTTINDISQQTTCKCKHRNASTKANKQKKQNGKITVENSDWTGPPLRKQNTLVASHKVTVSCN